MKNNIRIGILPSVVSIVVILFFAACSTTRRIPEGEILYTGVKGVDFNTPEHQKLPSPLISDVKEAMNVAPNNPMPFMSPYVRTPFPIGLWVYNNWNDSAGGLKGWLYDKLVAQPVLVSDVRPSLRLQMIDKILENNGYFDATSSYEIISGKNPKKGRILYTIDAGEPFLIDSIILLQRDSVALCSFIDSLARRNKYLRKGERFSVDSLISVRTDITNRLRNRGYYYFRPDFIEFQADSTIFSHGVALRMRLADNIPAIALKQYRVGEVTTVVERQSTRHPGTPDTLDTSTGKVIVMRPARIRDGLIPSCVTFRKNRLFSVRDMDRTQTRLARLGIFSNIQIQPFPADTASDNNLLNVLITTRFDRPMEATIEMNATSKSNSYIGPGLGIGLTHHNVFGGGEKFNVNFTASYEWQTGSGRSSVFNSYEFGLKASLAFPRMLAPAFIRRSRREINWTRFNLGAEILNRPHYFKMWQADMGVAYEWRETRYSSHQFTPFKLSYTNLLSTTAEFDSIMIENPAIAQSFMSQFIPQMNYTYTFDKFFEREQINGINFQLYLAEAGNIFDAIYMLAGAKGTKKLFGTPFSQFVKGQAQLIYNRRLIPGTQHWWVSRLLIGAEHAYGNSTDVPYSEQFYIGGANSIRAFTVRSIGPGSYRVPGNEVNGYFDQTGTFKLELNTEYRFPLAGMLHGAVFLDAGNVWLLKNDPNRPGGLLQGKTFLRDIALGTGVGLRFDMGMIVIRGDLGYGLHAPYNTGNGGYFNIPFKDAFAFHLAIGYPF